MFLALTMVIFVVDLVVDACLIIQWNPTVTTTRLQRTSARHFKKARGDVPKSAFSPEFDADSDDSIKTHLNHH